MPKQRRPRRGSIAVKRVRARKIVHNILANSRSLPYIISKMPAVNGFVGWKAGMTQISYVDTSARFTKGKLTARAVTVLDAPSLFVCGVRYYDYATIIGNTRLDLRVLGEKWVDKMPKEIKNIYPAKKQMSDEKKKEAEVVRLLVCTQPSYSGMHTKASELMELDVTGQKDDMIKFAESLVGKTIDAESVFKAGDYVDVAAVTKGFGTMGPVKRYHIKIQGRKNDQHHRHTGSIGTQNPGRTKWTTPMGGQHGFFNRVDLNKRIVAISDDIAKVNPKGGFTSYGQVKSKYIIIEGSLPGPKKRVIFLRKSIRKQKTEPVEIKMISTLPQN